MSRATMSKRSRPSPANEKKPDKYYSRAVGKALDALDFIGRSPQPATLNEISHILKLTKASAFRILHTLETLGYLSKSADSRYSAASPALVRAQTKLLHDMLRFGAEPLERLSLEFRETASMAVLFENHIEVLAVVESPQLIRMGNTVGRIVPPHASSLGKAITAFQPPETRDRLLRSYGAVPITPATITDEIALRAEYARVQKQGYAEDREESAAGGWCFAAPLLSASGSAFGAVSLSMPILRLPPPGQRAAILAAVKRTAAEIQSRCRSRAV